MDVIHGSYDLTLVFFSIMTAIIAAYISIDLLDMYLCAEERAEKFKWRIFSATSLGLGIWMMHFVGMFAYKMPMAVHYDGLITLASLFVAIVACYIGIGFIRKTNHQIMAYGSIFMGSGIASMHYLGMHAMHMPAHHIYNYFLLVVSVVVAIVVSGIGLLMVKHLHDSKKIESISLKLVVATVLGMAVSSMHYLGMAAMTHVTADDHGHMTADSLFIIDSAFLMSEMVIGGMVLLMFSFYTVSSERSVLKALKRERLLLKSSENKLSTLLSHIADAVIVINNRGQITMFNYSAEKMFGYQEAEVLGENISILMAGKDQAHHDDYMQHYQSTGESRIIDVGTRQLTAVNKKGKEILIGLSVNKVETEEGDQYIGVIRDMTEHRRELDKLTERADCDSLTGLANRHKLFMQLEHAIALAKRNDTHVCLMFIDLDGFKEVNDKFGHAEGDELLRQIAVLLREKTRESDVIARFGGDEFCILFEYVHGCEGMNKMAGSIIDAFKSPFHLLENSTQVTASIGVAFYPEDTDQEGDLLKYADSAMYEAKQAGKNQYKFYSESALSSEGALQ